MASKGGAWGSGGGAWGNSSAGRKYEDDESEEKTYTNGLFATSTVPPSHVALEMDTPPPKSNGTGYGMPPAGSIPSTLPPGYTTGMLNELSQREKELRRREEDLKRKEEELRRGQHGDMERKRNWPICCPIIFHSISEECQPAKAKMVRMAYNTFLFFIVMLVWQFICVSSMVLRFHGGGLAAWFLCSIYMLAGMPGAYFLWYKRCYNLGKTGYGHIRCITFLLIHFGFCLYCTIAIPIKSSNAVDGGAVTGYLSASSAFSRSKSIGCMYISGAVGWTVETIFAAIVIGMIYKDFRGISK